MAAPGFAAPESGSRGHAEQKVTALRRAKDLPRVHANELVVPLEVVGRRRKKPGS
jgi:hypothetical protein